MQFLILLAQGTPPSGWDAIEKGHGIAISLTGMVIVFAALTIITVLIGLVPKVLDLLDPILPKSHSPHGPATPAEQTPLNEEKVVAAIGMVLHTELQKLTTT